MDGLPCRQSMRKRKTVTEVQQQSLVRFYAYMNKDMNRKLLVVWVKEPIAKTSHIS